MNINNSIKYYNNMFLYPKKIVHKMTFNCISCKNSHSMQWYDHDYVSNPNCNIVNIKNIDCFISNFDCVQNLDIKIIN